ncbi:MAG: phosphoglycolate phosphatase, partial [Gammaproteobacteria bacterium]|nr:phosphoglycolate phosphatase [Gammaproteobacteria bacterium]
MILTPDCIPHCFLFDLDGTLVDTAPDLAATLNALRAEHGLVAMPFDVIRPHVSHGARAMVRVGFGIDEGDARFTALRERFLEIYRERLMQHSRLFDGMEEVLATLENRGVKWGVVTNKPAWLTEPLLKDLGLAPRAACVISGDSTRNRKPHPEPLLHASALVGVAPEQCLYIGDAQRDIEAGRAAGMKTLVALFGYLGQDDRPQEWDADGMIDSPLEILDW